MVSEKTNKLAEELQKRMERKRAAQRVAKHAKESEKAIERRLVARANEWGGTALKYESKANAGYPDRIVLLPQGRLIWVEVKSKGQKPRRLQALRIQQLRRVGQCVAVVDSPEAVDSLQEYYEEWKQENGI